MRFRFGKTQVRSLLVASSLFRTIMFCASKWLALLAGVGLAAAQLQFDTQNAFIAPLHLSSITSKDAFTTLNHPRFPNHSVRVKKSDFCDSTVKLSEILL